MSLGEGKQDTEGSRTPEPAGRSLPCVSTPGLESSRACGSLGGSRVSETLGALAERTRDSMELNEYLVSFQPLTYRPGFIPFPGSISLHKHKHDECPLTHCSLSHKRPCYMDVLGW